METRSTVKSTDDVELLCYFEARLEPTTTDFTGAYIKPIKRIARHRLKISQMQLGPIGFYVEKKKLASKFYITKNDFSKVSNQLVNLKFTIEDSKIYIDAKLEDIPQSVHEYLESDEGIPPKDLKKANAIEIGEHIYIKADAENIPESVLKDIKIDSHDMVRDLNDFSRFVQIDILKKNDLSLSLLAAKRWLLVAEEAFSLGDFQTVQSILSALNSASVSRLFGMSSDFKTDYHFLSDETQQQIKKFDLIFFRNNINDFMVGNVIPFDGIFKAWIELSREGPEFADIIRTGIRKIQNFQKENKISRGKITLSEDEANLYQIDEAKAKEQLQLFLTTQVRRDSTYNTNDFEGVSYVISKQIYPLDLAKERFPTTYAKLEKRLKIPFDKAYITCMIAMYHYLEGYSEILKTLKKGPKKSSNEEVAEFEKLYQSIKELNPKDSLKFLDQVIDRKSRVDLSRYEYNLFMKLRDLLLDKNIEFETKEIISDENKKYEPIKKLLDYKSLGFLEPGTTESTAIPLSDREKKLIKIRNQDFLDMINTINSIEDRDEKNKYLQIYVANAAAGPMLYNEKQIKFLLKVRKKLVQQAAVKEILLMLATKDTWAQKFNYVHAILKSKQFFIEIKRNKANPKSKKFITVQLGEKELDLLKKLYKELEIKNKKNQRSSLSQIKMHQETLRKQTVKQILKTEKARIERRAQREEAQKKREENRQKEKLENEMIRRRQQTEDYLQEKFNEAKQKRLQMLGENPASAKGLTITERKNQADFEEMRIEHKNKINQDIETIKKEKALLEQKKSSIEQKEIILKRQAVLIKIIKGDIEQEQSVLTNKIKELQQLSLILDKQLEKFRTNEKSLKEIEKQKENVDNQLFETELQNEKLKKQKNENEVRKKEIEEQKKEIEDEKKANKIQIEALDERQQILEHEIEKLGQEIKTGELNKEELFNKKIELDDKKFLLAKKTYEQNKRAAEPPRKPLNRAQSFLDLKEWRAALQDIECKQDKTTYTETSGNANLMSKDAAIYSVGNQNLLFRKAKTMGRTFLSGDLFIGDGEDNTNDEDYTSSITRRNSFDSSFN